MFLVILRVRSTEKSVASYKMKIHKFGNSTEKSVASYKIKFHKFGNSTEKSVT